MKKISVAFAVSALFASVATAEEIVLQWTDNSVNESGFEMRGLKDDGTWEPIARTVADVTEIVVETGSHSAWQVFAFNDWGFSGGSNILTKGDKPEAPGQLKTKKPQSNQVTRYDNVRKYQEYAIRRQSR
jgi:hypothetical protein